jgi:hypothetical protein
MYRMNNVRRSAPVKTVADLGKELMDKYRAAGIVHTDHGFRDTFDRAHSQISVELCQGEWCTFGRRFARMGEPVFKRHASRDDARAHARKWLA